MLHDCPDAEILPFMGCSMESREFHTYECWYHNATGTPQHRKPYMKIAVFGGVMDPRECWRNKGVGEDGRKAIVFSVV